jgi:serine/threonine-protein kinase
MEVVGKGGYSTVYRALERGSDAEVAIKVPIEGSLPAEELEQRIQREHEVLQALSGTKALHAHGVCREESVLCLVTELLRGQDFDDYLSDIEDQGMRIDVGTLVEFVDPIVETLAIAHERGIVHRDLKPGNVFILGRGGPGGVRLLDFGLSSLESSTPITRDGVVIGSPSYIAPEVWKGRPRELDHRVDVYSLGAVLFRAFAGRVPFPAPSLREKLRVATTAERPSLHALRPDLPPAVDPWVGKVLALDRDDRFPSVRDMWKSLLALLDVSAPRNQTG